LLPEDGDRHFAMPKNSMEPDQPVTRYFIGNVCGNVQVRVVAFNCG